MLFPNQDGLQWIGDVPSPFHTSAFRWLVLKVVSVGSHAIGLHRLTSELLHSNEFYAFQYTIKANYFFLLHIDEMR